MKAIKIYQEMLNNTKNKALLENIKQVFNTYGGIQDFVYFYLKTKSSGQRPIPVFYFNNFFNKHYNLILFLDNIIKQLGNYFSHYKGTLDLAGVKNHKKYRILFFTGIGINSSNYNEYSYNFVFLYHLGNSNLLEVYYNVVDYIFTIKIKNVINEEVIPSKKFEQRILDIY